MEQNRKQWNERQKKLRELLNSRDHYADAISLFSQQHAEVHSGEMSSLECHSFVDEVLNELSDEHLRRIPARMEHSIAWNLWHLARIEDVAMNMLVAGRDQLFLQDGWDQRLGVSFTHTGNAMPEKDTLELSSSIALDELMMYRLAVGRTTEEIVQSLRPEELQEQVLHSRLELVVQQGAVVEEAKGLIDYWGKRTIAGLLLMPPTRHCFVHLNEASKIRAKMV